VDFIERLLHVSPDSGNGLTEAALLAVIVLALALSAIALEGASPGQ